MPKSTRYTDEYLVIDIESAPQETPDEYIIQYFKERKWEKKQKSEEVEKVDRIIEPTLAQIICCCLKTADDMTTFIGNEKSILKDFWEFMEAIEQAYPRAVYVTFNGLNFDFPFIEMRSNILGIQHFKLPMRRYDTSKHFDIRMVLTNWDNYGLGNLDFWCYVFGIKRKEGIIKSDEVVEYYLKGDIDKVKEHCGDDVSVEEQLYLKVR